MLKIGFVGWRGLVGSVLLDRMLAEKDFNGFDPLFFTTSQVGQTGPKIGFDIPLLMDAYDLEMLSSMDIIVSCQGGGFTNKVYHELRNTGWKGYWIDSASTLRMEKDSIIVLDPVNRSLIEDGLKNGIKNFVGGNCTVSLMLMALHGLFEHDCIEWLTSMTYQAASGAGAKNMRELVTQMVAIGKATESLLGDPNSATLEIDWLVSNCLRSDSLPVENFGMPLAGSLIPWIDKPMESGQTREEWKGFVEANKILGRKNNPIFIDGQCVRIGAMRCHSQAFTIKLRRDISLDEITDIINNANEWVKIVPNNKKDTLKELAPTTVSGNLSIPVGRIRKMNMGAQFLTAFTVGDQLLWGAAEPIRRILKIVLEYLG